MTAAPRTDAFAHLGKAADDVRAARTRLREEQEAAWRRYVSTVDAALAEDLATTDEPVREALDALHGRLDELRVRAHLGRMEASDLLEAIQEGVDRIARHLTPG